MPFSQLFVQNVVFLTKPIYVQVAIKKEKMKIK